MTSERTRDEAHTILNQLGGTRRLAMMTGAKHFAFGAVQGSGSTYVGFSIGRNAFRINRVQITLDPSDTYTVEFMNATVHACTVKSSFGGVYFDVLPKIFEEATGMYLSL